MPEQLNYLKKKIHPPRGTGQIDTSDHVDQVTVYESQVSSGSLHMFIVPAWTVSENNVEK